MATNPLSLGRRMKPTQKHRPAIWECMLGTVYARNAEGETRYFDYDWDAAIEFSGALLEGADPRVWRSPDRYANGPGKKQLALYVRRT